MNIIKRDALEKLMEEKLIYEAEAKYNSLDCCTAAVPAPCVGYKEPKKQEKKMYDLDMDYSETNNLTADERKAQFLSQSLQTAASRKRGEAWSAFHMDGTDAPKSPKEFVDFIKEGKFQFSKAFLNDDGTWRDEEDHPYFYSDSMQRFLKWDDPAQRPDKKGWEAASEKIHAATTTAERAIVVGTPAEGLKALEEFEATIFH
jgi:hypothetical protein